MDKDVIKSEAGFSLLEVLIALTIFAIGLLATAGMQVTALQSNARAHSTTTINAVAAGIMEEIVSWAPDDPRLVDENSGNPHVWDFDPTANVNNTLSVQGGGSFNARYFVQSDTPVEKVSTITLEVDLTGGFTNYGAKRKVLTCLKKTH